MTSQIRRLKIGVSSAGLSSDQSRYAAIARIVAMRIKQLLRVFKHRRDMRDLATFDDHMLADIGLTRSDIRDALAEPRWRDPTALLLTRAPERGGYRSSVGVDVFSAPSIAPGRDNCWDMRLSRAGILRL